jgi:hypothetical protein
MKVSCSLEYQPTLTSQPFWKKKNIINVTTLTLGSWLSLECKSPWGQENLLRCETCSHKWGRVQGMKPNDSQVPLWELHSCMSCKCLKPWFERKTNIKLGLHDTIKKILKLRCLKCPHIVHLDLIFMSYDQKKRCESNWEFDSWPQTPWKKGTNEHRLRCAIHGWKDFFEGYKTFPLNSQNIFDLKKIWMSKVLG